MSTVLDSHAAHGAQAAGRQEPVARLVKILACAALTIAGAYFALLYLLASR